MSTITDALPISKKDLLNLMNAFIPKGMIAWFALDEAPEGWAVYEPLIGRYPLGDNSNIGSTVKAGIPDIIGEFPGVGENSGIHSPDDYLNGAFERMDYSEAIKVDNSDGGSAEPDVKYMFRASKGAVYEKDGAEEYFLDKNGNLIDSSRPCPYGNSDTVTPPSVKLLPCIKL